MKFSIITFGCKVNAYESEYMKEELVKNGYIYTFSLPEANLIIINTCSVTNTADNKCKKMIRSVKRDNKEAILLVCGCTAENHKEALSSLGIDILIGNQDKANIVSILEEYQKNKKKYVHFYEDRAKKFEPMHVTKFQNLTRAYVKIQDGCNNFCSYCIIPYVRGNIRSKDLQEAITEIKELVLQGHKEIVFTGINTGAYGKETGEYDLVTLIEAISLFPELERIRISSIEITEIDDRFIEELRCNKKICGHLHVSLQSGSDRILKLMHRKYTKEQYLEKIRKIREARPYINLTTDVIVGFPGETEEDFLECVSFCQLVGFSKIHVFPYSKREGTKAASMPNQLDNKIKKERAKRLIAIDTDLERQYNKQFIHQNVSVLIEEFIDGYSIGHTENFLKVMIPMELPLNKMVIVTITEIYADYVVGSFPTSVN